MCGISGIVSKKLNVVPQSWIKEMTDVISYRGPDDFGYFIDKNLAFGHRRLSILDLSSAGHQPMHYKSLTITYNGEVYNYIELREELISLGYNFQTETDTEVILMAYHAWGNKCLIKFNGMWAFSIYNQADNTLFCSRDRFGIKPFCYTVQSEYFAFASEFKQILTLPNFDKTLDYQVVYNYLHDNLLNSNVDTFFDHIKELPGGHYLEYHLDKHQINIQKWYTIQTTQVKLDFEAAASTFKALFLQSMQLRMRSDVAVGSCLSGGLDSSSIVSSLKYLNSANEIKTVSTCFSDLAIDEQIFIDQVTEQTKYTSIKVFPDLDDLINKNIWNSIIYHQDQPILSFSHFSEYKVFETAKLHNLIVMLDGQGADEYLAGYSEYWGLNLSLLSKNKQYFKILRSLVQRANLLKEPVRPFVTLHVKKYVKNKITSKSNQSNEYLKQEFAKKYKNRIEPDFKSLSELSVQQILKTSIPYQLHSEDRNSMLHSIESRLPFLDYLLIEFALSLPDGFKLRKSKKKAILREAMKDILPIGILNRHDKKGFPSPDETWFKNNKSIIYPMLKDAVEKNSAIFTNKISSDYLSFVEGKQAYSNIWLKAISFQKWKEIFNVD